MKPRIYLLPTLFIVSILNLNAQIEKWTTVKFGELQCDFPKEYKPIKHSSASGVFYDGANIYLAVTALPDTSKMKGNPDRDFTKDFMMIVLDVSRKLNGKVREYRDTAIGNLPGYVSKMEITLPEGKKSYYELLQLVHQDSVRGFSCQYLTDEPGGIKACQRFFRSIEVKKGSAKRSQPKNLGLWAGGVLLLAVAGWLLMRRTVAART